VYIYIYIKAALRILPFFRPSTLCVCVPYTGFKEKKRKSLEKHYWCVTVVPHNISALDRHNVPSSMHRGALNQHSAACGWLSPNRYKIRQLWLTVCCSASLTAYKLATG